MNQKLGLQQNNEGFSLVELIVTILISSVVMAGVVGLLMTGLNLYKNVNAETLLQTEGQAACGRINELVQEAQQMTIYNGISGSNKALVLMTIEETDPSVDAWWYYIVWDADGKMLLLDKDGVTLDANGVLSYVPDEPDVTDKVIDMIGATQKKKYLLAQYIEDFQFSEVDTKLFYLDVLLATEGRQFATSQFISERNK